MKPPNNTQMCVSKFFMNKDEEINQPVSTTKRNNRIIRKRRKSINEGTNIGYKHQTYSLTDFETFASSIYEDLCNQTKLSSEIISPSNKAKIVRNKSLKITKFESSVFSTQLENRNSLEMHTLGLSSTFNETKNARLVKRNALNMNATELHPRFTKRKGARVENEQIMRDNMFTPNCKGERKYKRSSHTPFLQNNTDVSFNQSLMNIRRKSHSDCYVNICPVLNKRRCSTSICEGYVKDKKSTKFSKHEKEFYEKKLAYRDSKNDRINKYRYASSFIDEDIERKNKNLTMYLNSNDIHEHEFYKDKYYEQSPRKKNKHKFNLNPLTEYSKIKKNTKRRSSDSDEVFTPKIKSPLITDEDDDDEVFTSNIKYERKNPDRCNKRIIEGEERVKRKILNYKRRHQSYRPFEKEDCIKKSYYSDHNKQRNLNYFEESCDMTTTINKDQINAKQIYLNEKQSEVNKLDTARRKRLSEEFIKELNEELEKYEKNISEESVFNVANSDEINVIHKDNINVDNKDSANVKEELKLYKNIYSSNENEDIKLDRNNQATSLNEINDGDEKKTNECAINNINSDVSSVDAENPIQIVVKVKESSEIEIPSPIQVSTIKLDLSKLQEIKDQRNENKIIKMVKLTSDDFDNNVDISLPRKTRNKSKCEAKLEQENIYLELTKFGSKIGLCEELHNNKFVLEEPELKLNEMKTDTCTKFKPELKLNVMKTETYTKSKPIKINNNKSVIGLEEEDDTFRTPKINLNKIKTSISHEENSQQKMQTEIKLENTCGTLTFNENQTKCVAELKTALNLNKYKTKNVGEVAIKEKLLEKSHTETRNEDPGGVLKSTDFRLNNFEVSVNEESFAEENIKKRMEISSRKTPNSSIYEDNLVEENIKKKIERSPGKTQNYSNFAENIEKRIQRSPGKTRNLSKLEENLVEENIEKRIERSPRTTRNSLKFEENLSVKSIEKKIERSPRKTRNSSKFEENVAEENNILTKSASKRGLSKDELQINRTVITESEFKLNEIKTKTFTEQKSIQNLKQIENETERFSKQKINSNKIKTNLSPKSSTKSESVQKEINSENSCRILRSSDININETQIKKSYKISGNEQLLQTSKTKTHIAEMESEDSFRLLRSSDVILKETKIKNSTQLSGHEELAPRWNPKSKTKLNLSKIKSNISLKVEKHHKMHTETKGEDTCRVLRSADITLNEAIPSAKKETLLKNKLKIKNEGVFGNNELSRIFRSADITTKSPEETLPKRKSTITTADGFASNDSNLNTIKTPETFIKEELHWNNIKLPKEPFRISKRADLKLNETKIKEDQSQLKTKIEDCFVLLTSPDLKLKKTPTNDKLLIKNKTKGKETVYTPPLLRNPKWIPPKSPHNLIEESLYDNPWGLLAATIFLNKTTCALAYPHITEFLRDYPTPEHVLTTKPAKLERYFTKIGLVKRSVQVWRMSHDFVHKRWMDVKELHGIGKYGSDAFQMFCLGNMNVEPGDRFLRIYKAWYKMFAENK